MKALFFLLIVSLHVAFGLESKTIVDMYGRTVNIPSTVHSVVTAGGTPAVNSFVFALGAQDTITNGLPGAIDGKNWKMQTLFAPKLASLPTVSNGGPEWDINVEALHTIAHDVVFVVNQNSAESLAQKGFCVVALQWSTPYSVKETMTLLGEILGLQNRAAAYNDYYDRTLRFVAQKVAHVSSRPKALYLRYTNFSLPMVSTATWMIEHAGGINIHAAAADQVSAQQVRTDDGIHQVDRVVAGIRIAPAEKITKNPDDNVDSQHRLHGAKLHFGPPGLQQDQQYGNAGGFHESVDR